ncbi:MAG: DUF4129 domain-containing protein [Actinobacteria bacterium]|nr:DUF4129 domain-containing protein [Actinomycetota bacterium]
MFEKAIERYRSINKKNKPEESVLFRAGVLVMVLISVFAAVKYSGINIVYGILVIIGVVAGFYFSYRTRYKLNLGVKFVLSILLLVVFVLFWVELGTSIFDLRYPLIRLFLGLQVLHSFDLPTRRDLDFSMISAAILMAFSGSLSTSNDYLFLLIPFFISALLTMYAGRRSSFSIESDVVVRGKGRRPAASVALSMVALVPLTFGVFIFLPRLPGFSNNYLPVSRGGIDSSEFRGLIKNPGYEQFPDDFPSEPLQFDPDAYYGFNRFMDLRVRGVPSDKIVMKVRSDIPAYWRATAFDKFLGNGWENTIGEEEREEITSNDLPLVLIYPDEAPRYVTQDVIQTFLIERPLPNTLFAAYIPRDLYFPTRIAKVDSLTTVLLPVTLDPGLVYTVVSDVSVVPPERLQAVDGMYPPGLMEVYCQLPEMSSRVSALAMEITAGLDNNYDKVMALSDYLKESYRYDLDVPQQDNDENTVEFFLFSQKRGYCEHFSTALAVMCRSIGIPARVAVGYSTGDFNNFTGYFEVSGRDAHAWVEVYFPFFGWIEFDPTPGWENPQEMSTGNSTWTGLSVLGKIGSGIAGMFPESWRSGAGDAFAKIGRSFKSFFSELNDRWRGIAVAFGVFGTMVLFFYLFRFSRGKRRQAAVDMNTFDTAVILFNRLCLAGAKAGVPRRSSQTPFEYGRFLDRITGTPEAGRAAALFNRAWFGGGTTSSDLIRELESSVTEAEQSLKKHKKFHPGKDREQKTLPR